MKNIINAQRKDKEQVVAVLYHAFVHDPHIHWLVGEGRGKRQRMKRLMSYAFEHCLVNGSVQLTEDRKAVALWKDHRSRSMSVRLMLENIKFLLDFGFRRVARIARMEKEVSKRYPKELPFRYLWFIGTQPGEQGKGYGSALLQPALAHAREEQQEVYLETTTEANLSYYRKKGFVLYDTVEMNDAHPLTIFLLKREATHVDVHESSYGHTLLTSGS